MNYGFNALLLVYWYNGQNAVKQKSRNNYFPLLNTSIEELLNISIEELLNTSKQEFKYFILEGKSYPHKQKRIPEESWDSNKKKSQLVL